MNPPKKIAIVGAPLDLGTDRRGVDMGPSAIRYSGLDERIQRLGLEVNDYGNVAAEIVEVAAEVDEHARYLPAILATCSQIASTVQEVADGGEMPLVLGGDHSIAMGTLAGLHAARGPGGVLWVDAHADMNQPSNSPSGNVHGMPLAAALGRCGFSIDGMKEAPWVNPKNVALIGVRLLDPGEKELIRELGIRVMTMSDVDRLGIEGVLTEALDVVKGAGFLHLSFDVDVCDPGIAPGVGTPVQGGLSYREAHLFMELLADSGEVDSMEIVEVNPIVDHAGTTGQLAVELVASALGETIL